MRDQLSGSLGTDLHVRNLELDCLILADRLSKLYSLFGISHCLIDTSLCYSDTDDCSQGTCQIQSLHSGNESGSLLTQTVLCRNSHILQNHITGGRAADTHLVLMVADA